MAHNSPPHAAPSCCFTSNTEYALVICRTKIATSVPPRLTHSAARQNHMLQPGLRQLPTRGKPRLAATNNSDANHFHLSWSHAALSASEAWLLDLCCHDGLRMCTAG
jgi:hypothetical protein